MYTTTPKQQEGCTFKDSRPKCFITTNFDKFHREAVAKAMVNPNGVCNYHGFIQRDGLSLAVVIVRYRSVRVRRKY